MTVVCLNILFWLIEALLFSVHLITHHNLAKDKIPTQAIECLLGLCHFYSLMLRRL
jgi:hypothetical protein